MSNSCFGCMSNTMLGIIRALLMISCVLLLLSQLLAIYGLYTVEKTLPAEYMLGERIGCSTYLELTAMAVLAIIGCYGTYTKDPSYLKFFAIVISIYAVCSVVVYDHSIQKEWENQRPKFNDQMEDFARSYKWNLAPDQKDTATNTWDILQRGLLCCGLDGPKDWPQKWKVSRKNALPKSCCVLLPRSVKYDEDPTCTLQYAFEDGCTKKLDLMVGNHFKYTVYGAIYMIVLGLWALLLARNSEWVMSVANSPNASTRQYSRFDGSVYVRQPQGGQGHVNIYSKQPPTVPGYVDSKLYPNLHSNEDGSPPPKYENRS